MCNPLFKFRVLTEWADKLNCAWVATGHYSRLEEKNGNIYIVAGDDDKKDQSYFLWRLGQDVLKRCIFPLGDYTKVKVREYLAEKGYEAKSKEGESMEVCFIKGDYRDFLREQCPELDSEIGPGWFVNSEGVNWGNIKEHLIIRLVNERTGDCFRKACLCVENQSAEKYSDAWRCRPIGN